MRKSSLPLLCILQLILKICLAKVDLGEGARNSFEDRTGNEHGRIIPAECITCGINGTFVHYGVCKSAKYRETDAPTRSQIQVYFHVVSMKVVEIKQKEKNIFRY